MLLSKDIQKLTLESAVEKVLTKEGSHREAQEMQPSSSVNKRTKSPSISSNLRRKTRRVLLVPVVTRDSYRSTNSRSYHSTNLRSVHDVH